MTEKIVEVTDEDVVIERTVSLGGRERRMPPARQRRLNAIEPPEGVDTTFSREKLTVGDVELDCLVMTMSRDGREQKVWLCDAIPVTGLVKIETDGRVVRELIEWGTDG